MCVYIYADSVSRFCGPLLQWACRMLPRGAVYCMFRVFARLGFVCRRVCLWVSVLCCCEGRTELVLARLEDILPLGSVSVIITPPTALPASSPLPSIPLLLSRQPVLTLFLLLMSNNGSLPHPPQHTHKYALQLDFRNSPSYLELFVQSSVDMVLCM